MADRGDTHYFTPTLNRWFLLSSLLFLAVTVWMMVADWHRPWKQHQRELRAVEVRKAQALLATLETSEALGGEQALRESLARAREELAGRQAALDAATAEAFALKGEAYVKDQEAKFAKADYDWTRYLIEEERTRSGDPDARQAELAAILDRVNATAYAKEQAEARHAEARRKVEDLMRRVTEVETRLAAETRDLERVRKRLNTLSPADPAVRIANVIRDAPGLDFIGPQLKVQKQVLDKLTFELNFTKTVRVDMCTTCHAAADREGFEEETDREPLRSHPRLDLFLTARSPHPVKDVGCTICHRGAGEALDFVRADHVPSDPAEAARWKQERGWHKQHHWDYPMLSTANVEASCVQCHKTSMELIADEAPRVTQGYRLFERYGCYSCHKVDWFPTTRRPGPSLRHVQDKARPDWIASWIAHPKSFRPTTWMPQIFHLENYPPEAPVVKSGYGAGPDILGRQWNDTSVASITAFLLDRTTKSPPAPLPVEGDAHRGREVFRLSGCLACHNLAPHEGEEPRTKDLAFDRRGTNEHGPNLRGVAAKVNPEWLFAWIQDPQAYWPGTRMPDLRLPDQDAADIVAYMTEDPDAIFRDVPEGWKEEASPVDAATLREQARWFFNKLGRTEIQRRLEGRNPDHRWDDLERLKVVVGEQHVLNQGCFSCHEIPGMENEMPIGTELSNWSSKTVDKLDFGYAYQKDLAGRPKLDHDYREGWLARKLDAPRSFDHEKVKNPKEKLRMPWFSFTEEEIDALSTFVLGLVDDEVQRARMNPSADALATDAGLRGVRQMNCQACHSVEPGLVTWRDGEGVERSVPADLVAFEEDVLPPPMDGLAALDAWIARYQEEHDEEVEEVGFRLLGTVPGIGVPGEKVFVERGSLVALAPPRGGDFVRVVADYYYHGAPVVDPEGEVSSATADPENNGLVQDVDGALRDYTGEPYDKVRWTYAPPVLWDEGGKLQREWFYSFLQDPVPLRQQMRVRMPTFAFPPGEAGAIADSFAHASARAWPALYARRMRHALGLELDEAVQDAPRVWPQVLMHRKGTGNLPVEEVAREADLEPSVVTGIERGARADIVGGFDKLFAFGERRGFAMSGPVDPAYGRVMRRAPSWLEARGAQLAHLGGPVALGQAVGVQGPNCHQCHFHQGLPPDQKDSPLSWGPDLALTRERLREAWVEEWLWNPALKYPGTSMPANFQNAPPQYQQIYPDSSNADQIQAVMDWLFNLDRSVPAPQ